MFFSFQAWLQFDCNYIPSCPSLKNAFWLQLVLPGCQHAPKEEILLLQSVLPFNGCLSILELILPLFFLKLCMVRFLLICVNWFPPLSLIEAWDPLAALLLLPNLPVTSFKPIFKSHFLSRRSPIIYLSCYFTASILLLCYILLVICK